MAVLELRCGAARERALAARDVVEELVVEQEHHPVLRHAQVRLDDVRALLPRDLEASDRVRVGHAVPAPVRRDAPGGEAVGQGIGGAGVSRGETGGDDEHSGDELSRSAHG